MNLKFGWVGAALLLILLVMAIVTWPFKAFFNLFRKDQT